METTPTNATTEKHLQRGKEEVYVGRSPQAEPGHLLRTETEWKDGKQAVKEGDTDLNIWI